MTNNEIEFTDDQFQYLEHLKIVYDATNEAFLKRQFADYIPLGLMVVYLSMSTLEKKYWNDPYMLNAKCLYVGKFFYGLILNNGLGLLGNDYIPIHNDVIKKWINDIDSNKSDNYANLLIKLVPFEGLYNVLSNHSSISSNDNRIKAVLGLWNGIIDTNFKFDSEYKSNEILYTSISHLRKNAKVKSLLKEKGIDNPTIKRIELCIAYMDKEGFENGINLSEKKYTWKAWIAELIEHDTEFITNQDDFRKAAKLINLFTFKIGKPIKGDN